MAQHDWQSRAHKKRVTLGADGELQKPNTIGTLRDDVELVSNLCGDVLLKVEGAVAVDKLIA